MNKVVVVGGFDDLRSLGVRFLEEAGRLGELTVLLWSDESLQDLAGGKPPRFPQEERAYLVQAIRYVSQVVIVDGAASPHSLPQVPGFRPDIWAVDEAGADVRKKEYCQAHGLEYRAIDAGTLKKFPASAYQPGCEFPTGVKSS